MTKFPDFFAALGAEFEPDEVKNLSKGGREFSYVSAWSVQNRLDNVAGPENWWTEFTPHENSVECRLTIRLPDGTTVTKTDAGGYAGMADSGDDDKSGYSDGLKRAACAFGVGRYIRRDGVPAFVQERTGMPGPAAPLSEAAKNAHAGTVPRLADDTQPRDQPARQPDRQRPPEPAQDRRAAPAPQNGNGDKPAYDGPQRAPATGKALFAWSREQEQRHNVELVKYINTWSKLQDFPGRMIDFDRDQVALAHAEAVRKLATLTGQPAPPPPAPARAQPVTAPPDRGDSYEGDGDEQIPF